MDKDFILPKGLFAWKKTIRFRKHKRIKNLIRLRNLKNYHRANPL